MNLPVVIQRLTKEAILPFRATEGSAAFDLIYPGEVIIHPGFVLKLPLGFAMALPPFTCALILPRSGLASQQNLRPANTPGLIDPDYRGEIIVALENFGQERQYLSARTKVAQMLILPLNAVEMAEADSLPETVRGAGGFGSTGAIHA